MAFQSVPQTAGCTVRGVMDNQLVILDLNFVNSGAIVEANIADLLTSLNNWVQVSLAPLLSRDVTFNQCVGIDLEHADGPSVAVGFTAVGGVDVESAPNNVAACISFRTAQRGRSGHGRNYIPGIPNSLLSLNTMDSGFMDDLIVSYETLIGAGTFATGWQWCVVSRVSGGVPRPVGITIPITGVSFTKPTVSSMRSREVGHGA